MTEFEAYTVAFSFVEAERRPFVTFQYLDTKREAFDSFSFFAVDDIKFIVGDYKVINRLEWNEDSDRVKTFRSTEVGHDGEVF